LINYFDALFTNKIFKNGNWANFFITPVDLMRNKLLISKHEWMELVDELVSLEFLDNIHQRKS
jgi:hypothetical protein